MKFGKIRIEDGNIIFTKRVKTNTLPCSEILWAYRRREENGKNQEYSESVCVVTRYHKKYQFEMSGEEVTACIRELQKLNPSMTTGLPKGSRIPFQGLSNTRDLGGLKSEDGRLILPKKLIRSGDLYHLSHEDQKTLRKKYELSKVIDFRTMQEKERKPDTKLEGVTYVFNPILDEATFGITRESSMAEDLTSAKVDMGDFLEKVYRQLIKDPYALDQYAQFMDELLRQREGAVLYHCSAGKDRVGVGTALLLSALGIPRPVIMEDYLRTNAYLEEEAEYMIQLLETRMIVSPQIYSNVQAAFSVRRSYLEGVFQVIEEQYGSMEIFLRKKMYLSPKALEQLRNKYLI